MDDVRARLRDLAARSGLHEVPLPTLTAGLAVCGVVVVGALGYWWSSSSLPAVQITPDAESRGAVDTPNSDLPDASKAKETADPSGSATGTVCVHVVGAVLRPGVYRLAVGARVSDAIASAGGLLGSAEERAVNLARALVDGEQILIVTRDEYAAAGAGRVSLDAAGLPRTTEADAGVGAAGAGASVPVDINSADVAALDALPGVGPATAARIIADREANGPFASPEDLGRVSGIGEKKLEALKDLIVAR